MDRLIDAVPGLVTALGVALALAAVVLGLLVWWLRHPVEDEPEGD